jgi:predicted DNA-binding WGR domain protein
LDRSSGGSDTRLMSSEDMEPVHLRRIDSTRNMRRFYVLSLQPTLFGGASLVRHWGRISTNGQSMMETFDAPEEADRAFVRLERVKRKRGYRDAGASRRE